MKETYGMPFDIDKGQVLEIQRSVDIKYVV